MNSDALNMDRFTRPTTDAPHELADAVNRIRDAGLFTLTYDYGYWLKKVSEANFAHPEEEVRKLLVRMIETRDYIKREKEENMSCGGWLTNRLKELRSPQQHD